MEITLNKTVDLLKKAENLVLTGHISPDGDCLGSLLALYEYLVSSGKKVEILLDDDIPVFYSFLPGSDKICRPGDKQRKPDLLVVLDASDPERIAGVKAVVDADVLNIDHHVSNTRFADYLYLNSKAAATGEIIFEILRNLQAPITPTIAVNLYTAIATDCGFFRYANTTSTTLRYAGDLVDAGAKPHIISENLETKPLESIITLKKVLDTLEMRENGKIAAITISQDINDNPQNNTEGLINYPRNIEGVEIAIMFKIVDTQTTRVSFRSRNADVSKLALSFGGGGHIRAAGCTVNTSFDAAKKQVFAAAHKLLTENKT
jgi:phosphoesterase RecJ-like protein